MENAFGSDLEERLVRYAAVDSQSDPDKEVAATRRGRAYRSITFSAPPATLESLFAAQKAGELKLTWRPGA